MRKSKGNDISADSERQMSGTSDLISRQTALHRITSYNGVVDKSVAKRLLIQLPSVQPEHKPGKWVLDNNNYYDERYICSQCGANYKVDTCIGKPSWSFCPNCGARMETPTVIEMENEG